MPRYAAALRRLHGDDRVVEAAEGPRGHRHDGGPGAPRGTGHDGHAVAG